MYQADWWYHMGLKLYTPGHGLFTDSLMAYGIVSAVISVDPSVAEELRISFTGNEYVVDVGNLKLDDVAYAVASTIRSNKDDIVSRLLSKGRVIQLQSKGKLSGILERLSYIEEVRVRLNDLTAKGHILRSGEGRRKKFRLTDMDTIWLALMPSAGKYRLGEFSAKVSPYVACILCRGLAILGLYSMGLLSAAGKESLEVIPVFNGEVTGRTISSYMGVLSRGYSDVANKLGRLLDTLPSDLLSKLVLIELSIVSGGDRMLKELHSANSSWFLASVRFTKGASRLTGYDAICVDPLINGLSLAVEEGIINDVYGLVDTALRRLVSKKRLRSTVQRRQINVDVDTLDFIVKFLEHKDVDILYRSTRYAYKDEEVRGELSERLAKGLVKMIGA